LCAKERLQKSTLACTYVPAQDHVPIIVQFETAGVVATYEAFMREISAELGTSYPYLAHAYVEPVGGQVSGMFKHGWSFAYLAMAGPSRVILFGFATR